MQTHFKIAALLIFLFLSGASFGQGYKINVKIKNLSSGELYLGHHYGKNLLVDDTAQISANGSAVFEKDRVLPDGLYFVYLPTRSYFDIIIKAGEQSFSIENDTIPTEFSKNMVVKGSVENKVLYDYQRFLHDRNLKAKTLREELDNVKEDATKKEEIEKKLEQLNDDVAKKMEDVITKQPNLFFAKFLRATKQVEVPENIPAEDKYYYYKSHFLDNIDLKNEGIIRTPVFEPRLIEYFKIIQQQPIDSIKVDIDRLIAKSRVSPEMFKFVLISTFNHFVEQQIMGMDAVWVHIAEKYYSKEASWSSPEFLENLKTRVSETKPFLIGQKVPNIHVRQIDDNTAKAAENDSTKLKSVYGKKITLFDIKAKYIVLYFWESDCSHCKKSTPVLYKAFNDLKHKGLDVFSVHMLTGDEGRQKMVKFITANKLYGWRNCWNPENYQYKLDYFIKSSPVMYVLDEDKKIIAKSIGPEQVEDLMMNFMLDDEIGEADGEARIAKIKQFVDSFKTKEALNACKTAIVKRLKPDEKEQIEKYLDNKISKI